MSPVPTTPPRHRGTRVLVLASAVTERAALRAALAAPDLHVVGEGGDPGGCRRLCEALRPDVLLGDLVDRAVAGADLVRELTRRHPDLQALVLTASLVGEDVREILDAGAVGYLVTDVQPQALRDGVRAVVRGESPLDPRAVRALLRTRPAVRGEDLTVREREVLALVMRGLANKQIARALQIRDSTVKAHLGSIFARIGVTDRTAAALWAERNLRTGAGARTDARAAPGTAAAGAGPGAAGTSHHAGGHGGPVAARLVAAPQPAA